MGHTHTHKLGTLLNWPSASWRNRRQHTNPFIIHIVRVGCSCTSQYPSIYPPGDTILNHFLSKQLRSGNTSTIHSHTHNFSYNLWHNRDTLLDKYYAHYFQPAQTSHDLYDLRHEYGTVWYWYEQMHTNADSHVFTRPHAAHDWSVCCRVLCGTVQKVYAR